MPLNLRCESCGKTLALAPGDAGRRTMCSACGASFLAPSLEELRKLAEPPPPPQLSPRADQQRFPSLLLPGLGLPPTAQTQSPAPPPTTPTMWHAQPPLPPKQWPAIWGVVAAALIVLIITAGAVIVLLTSTNRPDASRPTAQASATTPPDNLPDADRSPTAQTKDPPPNAGPNPATRQTTTRPLLIPKVVGRPPPSPLNLENSLAIDELIGLAIRKGVDFMLSQFADGQLKGDRRDETYAGMNCLCVYALLQCGQSIVDERLDVRGSRMRDMLAKMKQLPMAGQCETYARGIRATALASANRPEDRPVLKADLAWLIPAAKNGGYTYGAGAAGPDNSNSQYGLLGAWSAAEVGLEVLPSYWTKVQKHWETCQLPTGQWGYTPGSTDDGSLSMTAAGLTSLFVTHDYLEAPQYGKAVGRAPFSKPLAAGLAWLAKADNCLRVGSQYPGYTLYGLERVGLASGFKYFGQHDWYAQLADALVSPQPSAAWATDLKDLRTMLATGRADARTDDIIDMAFALLFLARGRPPILMNKLAFDGAWANRPRDVANLARFASRQLERPLNWQIVDIDHDWTDWMDCPILYLASHESPKFSDEHCAKLRQFAEAGGLIFSQADGDSESFTAFITELGHKLFPAYAWQDLPPEHAIYTLNFRMDSPPPLRCLSNGSRMLMVHSPRDLAQHWQLRAENAKRDSFELGANLFIYAAGKTDLRNRLSRLYLPPLQRDPPYRIRLARVPYAGLWDPEPYAFVRLARWLEYQTGYRLDVSPVSPEWLRPGAWTVAHMTGAATCTLSESQVAALRSYVEDGGVLLIDACGGAPQFSQSAAALLQRAFPTSQLAAIAPGHPLLAGTAAGMDALPTPRLRPSANRQSPRIDILTAGKGCVIFSSLDLTTALLGTNTWDVLGYQPSYALSFVKNVLLWAADGAKTR